MPDILEQISADPLAGSTRPRSLPARLDGDQARASTASPRSQLNFTRPTVASQYRPLPNVTTGGVAPYQVMQIAPKNPFRRSLNLRVVGAVGRQVGIVTRNHRSGDNDFMLMEHQDTLEIATTDEVFAITITAPGSTIYAYELNDARAQ